MKARDYKAEHFLWSVDDDGVAVLTLNRPERKNPLTFDSYAEMRDLFRALVYADDCKVVIVTGALGPARPVVAVLDELLTVPVYKGADGAIVPVVRRLTLALLYVRLAAVLVRERHEPPLAVGVVAHELPEAVVDAEVTVLDLFPHGLQNDDVGEGAARVLQQIHLLEHHVGVQHEVLAARVAQVPVGQMRGVAGEQHPNALPGPVRVFAGRGACRPSLCQHSARELQLAAGTELGLAVLRVGGAAGCDPLGSGQLGQKQPREFHPGPFQ